MNSNFEFCSSATSKLDPEKPLLSSFSSLSRPRMAKSRKSLSSRSMGGSITGKMDPCFNQFHRVSDMLTGVSSSLDDEEEVSMNRNLLEVKNKAEKHGNAFIEVTGKLKVENTSDSCMDSQSANHMNEGGSASLSGNQQHNKGVEKSLPSELPDGMKKLNLGGSHGESSMMHRVTRDDIGGNREASLSFSSGGRNEVGLSGEVSGCNFVSTTAAKREFVLNSIRRNKDTIVPGLASTLPENIKNLNIEDSNKSNVVQKDLNANKNNKAFDSGFTQVIDPMILDEVERSNIGDCSDGFSDHSRPNSFSFLRKGGMGSTSKDASGDSMAFASLIKEHKDSSGPQVFVSQSNRGEFHSTSTFQSVGPNFQLLRDEFQNLCTDSAAKKGGFGFSGNHDSLRVPHVEFRSSDSKCNLISGSNQEIEFSVQKGSVKDTSLKGRKGKPKESSSIPVSLRKSFLPNNFEANSKPSESCSSMDVSPYQENQEEIQLTRGPSLTSDDQLSNDSRTSFCSYVEEDLVTASNCMDINKDNGFRHDDANIKAGTHEDSMSAVENHNSRSLKDSMASFEGQNFRSAYESMEWSGEKEVESNSEGQSSDGTQYFSASSVGNSSFTFAASSSAQGQASASIRYQKKKNRTKAGLDVCIPTRTVISDAAAASEFPPISRVSLLLSPVGQKDGVSNAFYKGDSNLKATCSTSKTIGDVNFEDTKREVSSQTSASCAAQEACEKWRLRGNQAYSSGHLEKAEDCYSQGLSCIAQNETSWEGLRALVLCYSNRAASLMCLRRVREALQDCLVAAELDPNFFRVQLRAANCYLALGEVGDASRYFQKLLQSTDVCVEQKLIQEASDGIQKAQKVSESIDRSAEFLLQGELSDVEAMLGVIADALVISPYSEQLLERKAEALFMLQRYEEVIQLCTQTLESAEKNSPLLGAIRQQTKLESSEFLKNYNYQIWRYRLIFKSNFHLGKLEESLDFLENQERWRSMVKNYGNETLQSLIPQLSNARELIRHKSAGNEAFQAGRHTEAVEHYSAALSLHVESRSFAAVCFGNRSAAYQALGQITDAIADCSLAIALDGTYLKAISRRATLYEMIRDYEQAAKDAQRLLSLLTKQAEGKANQSVASSAASSLAADLRQARQRLYQLEEQAKKGIPLNFYLILEVEPSVTTFDLKKAYRKAALKHHPDKASQSLARSEGGDEGFWKEIAEEVHKDADRLFKMIGEAYAVISDHTKRSQYDIEEEMRTGQRKSSSSSTTSRMHTDAPSNTSDRSGYDGGRKWKESWRFSGNPYYRGFEPTGPSRR